MCLQAAVRLTVRALIKSIGSDHDILTRRMIREAILDSDELKIDPQVSPYKDMIAEETRWWAYPEARSTKMEKAAVENKQAAAIITKMGKTAVEAKQAAEKQAAGSRKKQAAKKQVTFEDKTECNYAGCK